MNTVLFYDTETTGLPIWKERSSDPAQPHLVQLGAILCDADTKEVLQAIDLIIKPDGWEIPEEVAEIHGITTEKALSVGVSEKQAVDIFLQMRGDALRVAHNKTFDQRLIRIALSRYDFSDQVRDVWAEKEDHLCTMLMSKPVLQLEPRGRFGWKPPKLEEAYKHFTGKELKNAHTAMADARACMDIYFAMIDQQQEDVA
ncbi:DNA polymerase III subunit epsilon [Oleiphilus sp. HI0130]|nr:DNA polymerase III subunit epsilon [Oleiphilus sp. HI0130]KZZ72468.1 DNA polymerase III subunit epsilon [Oleiphilus sp. HI0130]